MVLTSHQIALLVVICVLGSIPIISGIAFLYWGKIVRWLSKTIYSIKFPHRLIEIIIRFPGNKFDKIYRLLPDEKRLGIGTGEYFFTEQNLSKHGQMLDKLVWRDKSKKLHFHYTPDFNGLIRDNMTKEEIKTYNAKPIDSYFISEEMLTKDKELKVPTVEYWFNCPNPIVFDFTHKQINLTSKQLKEYKENDLVKKLLRLSQEEMKMILIIILIGVAIIVGGISAYKSSQVYDGLIKAGVIVKDFIPILFIPLIKKRK